MGPKRRERPTSISRPRPEEAHICPFCSSELVQALDWTPLEAGLWRIERRCPECAWEGTGVFGQRAMDRFDAIADDAEAGLREDARLLERSIFEQEIEGFASALACGAVLPEDF